MDNSYAKATEVLKRNQVRIMRIRGVNGIGIGRGVVTTEQKINPAW